MVLGIIRSRRSVRHFLETPIPAGVVSSLLEAARWAPSGGNRQPWAFLVIQNPANIRKVKMFAPGLGGVPAALLVLCSDRSAADATAIMDVAMAAQNVMLVAEDHGVGSCVVRSFSQKALQTLLCLPSHVVPELLIALGFAAEPASNPGRRPVEELVHWEEWGGGSSE